MRLTRSGMLVSTRSGMPRDLLQVTGGSISHYLCDVQLIFNKAEKINGFISAPNTQNSYFLHMFPEIRFLLHQHHQCIIKRQVGIVCHRIDNAIACV